MKRLFPFVQAESSEESLSRLKVLVKLHFQGRLVKSFCSAGCSGLHCWAEPFLSLGHYSTCIYAHTEGCCSGRAETLRENWARALQKYICNFPLKILDWSQTCNFGTSCTFFTMMMMMMHQKLFTVVHDLCNRIVHTPFVRSLALRLRAHRLEHTATLRKLQNNSQVCTTLLLWVRNSSSELNGTTNLQSKISFVHWESPLLPFLLVFWHLSGTYRAIQKGPF